MLVSFSQDTLFAQFEFQDQIGIWLENSFMDIYPLCFNKHIMFLMIRISDELIISIFQDM